MVPSFTSVPSRRPFDRRRIRRNRSRRPSRVTVVPGSMVVVPDPLERSVGTPGERSADGGGPGAVRLPVRVPEEMELVMLVLDTLSVPERLNGRSASTACTVTDDERLT